MSDRADRHANDPVLVPIEDSEPMMSVDDWLAELRTLEPTEVDAHAAEILREIREDGER